MQSLSFHHGLRLDGMSSTYLKRYTGFITKYVTLLGKMQTKVEAVGLSLQKLTISCDAFCYGTLGKTPKIKIHVLNKNINEKESNLVTHLAEFD